jgi:hypothetical protein
MWVCTGVCELRNVFETTFFFCVDIKNFSACLWWNVPLPSMVTGTETLNVAVFYTSGGYAQKYVAVVWSSC